MKKIIVGISVFALLAFAFPVGADDTAVVSATVTPQNISVSVSPTSVDYGTLPLSTTDLNRSMAESVVITASNNGNVTEDFNIRGSNSTDWTLSSSPDATGTVGTDQFAHRFDAGSTFVNAEAAALDSVTYKSLSVDIVQSGNQDFVLQMNMPTSSSVTTQQSTDVTVQATAS